LFVRRKNGSSYSTTATLFPVYDVDITRTTNELTHFVAVFSNVVEASATSLVPVEVSERRSCFSSGSFSIRHEDFVTLTATARLSDILKFSLKCKDPLVLTDTTGRVIHTNKPWLELYGYSHCEVEGIVLLDVVTREMHTQEMVTNVFNPLTTFQCTSLHRTKEGDIFVCTMTVAPVCGMIKASGKITFRRRIR